MDGWLEDYKDVGKKMLAEGLVRSIEFSGPTYQVEVYDPKLKESYWPFLQFDEQGKLKDAFCSCEASDPGCAHLAAAYFRVNAPDQEPLHVRFEHSFWNHLCRLFADHSGYEERFLNKTGEGRYVYDGEVRFEIVAKTAAAKARLKEMLEGRVKATPENSIKFSNVNPDDIAHWREGRPSQNLRYALSLWSDLAQWMMSMSQEGKVTFEPDEEGYPTQIQIHFPPFTAHFTIQKRDLPRVIASLETVDSPLRVFRSVEEKVQGMTFNPQEGTLTIEHARLKRAEQPQQTLPLPGWTYLPGVGFYPKDDTSLLGQSHIGREEIPELLEQFPEQVTRFIPVHAASILLRYTMRFDSSWNWHFEAYLFEPGDLSRSGCTLLPGWAYLEGKGFYAVQDAVFDSVQSVVPADEVSDFVNHHRIWLNGQEGFQTHLASIESLLSYSVSSSGLSFHTKAPKEGAGVMDFGDWIYYSGLGFFSKQHARHGLVIRSGLTVEAEGISHLIRANKEELENIPRFFCPFMPLAARGLEVTVHASSSIHIKPVFTLLSQYEGASLKFFGDFVYIEGEGFHELPLGMRIPGEYMNPITVPQAGLASFLEGELPGLRKYIQTLDPALAIPHQADLSVHYLARTPGGGLKAQLFYRTEFGQVAVSDLLEAIEGKKRYCFTSGGLIDTQSEHFQWLRHFKNSFDHEAKTVQLSTMEFIRLDASQGLLGPFDESATSQVTRSLLKELREFTTREAPILKGLKSELRLYQQTGVHWLWFLYKHALSGLLCDDMGLGKTHQAMALLAATLNQPTNEKRLYLVVCPTSVIYHWQDKLETFLPHVKVHTFHGLKRSLKPKLTEGLVLTSYGILRLEQKMFENLSFDVAIFDEVQVAKNPSSRVHEALKKVQAKTRIGLTGTPIENNLRELKSLFDIVLPGYMPSEARFRELFINPIERDASEEKKSLLTKLIRPFVMRRRKAEVLQELPEKSEDKSYCDLSEEQQQLYQETLALNRESLVGQLRDQTSKVDYVHIFALLSRLKQVCNHPALVHKDPANYKKYESGKWDLFIELLDEARESDQKVVVFSQYLYMLDIIESYLKQRGWGYAQIRGDTLNRREELKRFQEDPSCVVFIGSLQAAGLGIDLTAASVVILYDRWWNAARENQAIDRVHRIGQKWGVQVYKLITKNTIEEKIDRMITRKGRLLEEVISVDDQSVLKHFTRSELIELLSFQEP